MRRDDRLWTQTLTPELAFAGAPAGCTLNAHARGTLELGAPLSAADAPDGASLRRGASADAGAVFAYHGPGDAGAGGSGFVQRSRDLLDVDRATVGLSGDITRWAAASPTVAQIGRAHV